MSVESVTTQEELGRGTQPAAAPSRCCTQNKNVTFPHYMGVSEAVAGGSLTMDKSRALLFWVYCRAQSGNFQPSSATRKSNGHIANPLLTSERTEGPTLITEDCALGLLAKTRSKRAKFCLTDNADLESMVHHSAFNVSASNPVSPRDASQAAHTQTYTLYRAPAVPLRPPI